jgi:hypothetical protein
MDGEANLSSDWLDWLADWRSPVDKTFPWGALGKKTSLFFILSTRQLTTRFRRAAA